MVVQSPAVALVLLAAGRGVRAGGQVPKQFQRSSHTQQPLFEASLATFHACAAVDEIVLVAPPEQIDAKMRQRYPRVRHVVTGGASRAESVRAGLAALSAAVEIVLIHDAARPWVSPAEVLRLLRVLTAGADAATLALPSTDSVVLADGQGRWDRPLDRSRVWRVQTPQGFRRALLDRAHAAAAQTPQFEPTDDCQVVHAYDPDISIELVPGEASNIKVTTPHELAQWLGKD